MFIFTFIHVPTHVYTHLFHVQSDVYSVTVSHNIEQIIQTRTVLYGAVEPSILHCT